MSHQVVEDERISIHSPAELTLQVLQQRLNQAEGQANKLVEHLETYGFKHTKRNESRRKDKDRRLPKKNKSGGENLEEYSKLQRNFEELVSRVCSMESMLQSLKTGVNGMEAERSVIQDKHQGELESIKISNEKEIKKLRDKISVMTAEASEMKSRNLELETEMEHLIESMKDLDNLSSQKAAREAELEINNEKLMQQKAEISEQLQREVSLRQSLEDAHEALLSRIRDMESVVDLERNQVNELVNNWDNTRKEEAATREAFENEHEMRMNLEAVVTQQEEDFGSCKDELRRVCEKNKILEADSTKLKQETKSLKQHLETSRKSLKELKVAYDSMTQESKKLQDALRIAATDNKALIAQHKDAVQREKDKVATKLAVQDQILDSAKEAILKELEKEKNAVRNIEKENVNLKLEIKTVRRNLEEKDNELLTCRRKWDFEIQQLKNLLENVKNDRNIEIEEKNEQILSMRTALEEQRKDISTHLLEMNQRKIEIERLKVSLKTSEAEKEHLVTRLTSAEKAQLSQKQIEGALTGMMEEKNRLAYEKGALETKVEQLSLDIRGLSATQLEMEQLKLKNQTLRDQYEKVSKEITMNKMELEEKRNKIEELKAVVDKLNKDMKSLVASREEALHEGQKLLAHTESLDERYTKKITAVQNALQMSQEDNKRLAESFDGIMISHSNLQTNIQELQTKLGRKDSEIQCLAEERVSTQKIVSELQQEMESLQQKILSFQDHESDEVKEMANAIAKLEKEKKADSQSIFMLKSDKKSLMNEIDRLRKELKEKNQVIIGEEEKRKEREKDLYEKNSTEKQDLEIRLEKRVRESDALKSELDQNQVKLTSSEEDNVRKRKKIKKLADELRNQKKELAGYEAENREQAAVIADLISQIESYKAELKATNEIHTQSNLSVRQFEEEIEKEKRLRHEAESRCINIMAREKALQKQLMNASKENIKAATSLKEAQIWFQRKVGKLEKELESAKQTQFVLEQTATEQEKHTETEKLEADEAKKLASRMVVSRLANDMTENLYQTKGLKHVIQAERDYAARASQKYDKLMQSSAKKVEELARELDRAHEKARKAR